MKTTILLLITLIVFGGINNAQSQEKEKWKEMDAFHEVMAKTFHPAEEGKLEPIKTVKKSLKELVNGAKEINNLVKEKAANDILKAKLSKLHDVFHEIMEKCGNENHM